MICSLCSTDVVEGVAVCPRCGARMPAGVVGGAAASGAAASGAAAAPHPALAAQAFSFDAGRWTRADRIAGTATLVLLISLFLPWFSVSAGFGNFTSSASVDALTAHGYLYLVLLLALGMVGYLVARAGFRDMPELPVNHDQLLAAGAAINLLLVLIAVVLKPGGGSSLVKVSWSFGAFVGLVTAIVAFAPLASSALRAGSALRARSGRR
jgi:hypothetical protein